MTRRPTSLRAKALAMLARREYSRLELERKLGQAQRAERRRQAKFAEAPTGDSDADDAFESDEPSAASAPCFAEDEEALRQTGSQEVQDILNDFEQRGWLSEARFVEASVNRLSRRYGPRRIEQTLRERGASAESIEAARPYLKSQAEATAVAALRRRFAEPPKDAAQRARQVRFLQARGFDYDVIRKVLNQTSEPAEE